MSKKCKVAAVLFLLSCVLLTAVPLNVKAGASKVTCQTKTSGEGNKIRVKKAEFEYEGGNRSNYSEISVDFSTRVSYQRRLKVTVKDSDQKTYRAYVDDKDSDECDIMVKDLDKQGTYTVTLEGIKKRGTGGYRTLALTMTLPGSGSETLKVKKITADASKKEIDINFDGRISWNRKAKVVSVKDNKGASYRAYLKDRDSDECEVYVKNMKYDRTYTIRISGVKAKKAANYTVAAQNFCQLFSEFLSKILPRLDQAIPTFNALIYTTHCDCWPRR